MTEDDRRHQAVTLALQLLSMRAHDSVPTIDELLNIAGKISRFVGGAK